MSNKNKPIMFAGPTLAGLPNPQLAADLGFSMLPPIRRGDLPRVLNGRPHGIVAIVDGLFHHALAVGHAEIRDAICNGWEIWGLCSIGAIRAHEMRHWGMKGFGRVYAEFHRHHDFKDDEVALLHEEQPPYRTISEPLVHLREAVRALQDHRLLDSHSGDEVLAALGRLYFGERTLPRLEAELHRWIAPSSFGAVREVLTPFGQYRLKTQDLLGFLTESPWRCD